MPVQQINIHESLQEQFLPYAGESLLNFLPMIDGMLSVNRKVALSMLRNGRTHNKPHAKTVKVMGEIVTYYVFGDSPLYGSMVNMANNGMNFPLIDGKGSWGNKFKSDGIAASQRYTECRMTKYAEDMLSGLNKNVVPMKPNFDNTTDEIVVAPSLIPNILLNTSQSISVSEASKIPAHNANDTCDSIISYINTRDIDEAIKIIKCPDLSSGGQVVYDEKTFEQIYKTGRGSFTLIGKYRYIEKENKIEIFEVPFETTINAIEEKLRIAFDKGNIKEISDIHNASGRQGIQLDVYLKRGTDIENFIAKLRKYTPFESKMSCNFTVLDLDWKTPKLMSLEDIYVKWIKHRFNCITNEINFDIDKKSKQLHNLKGLEKVLLDIDGVIRIIRNTEKESDVLTNLMNHLQIDEKQSSYIAEIKLRNLNKEYIIKRTNEISTLESEINDLQSKLDNPASIKQIIIEQLEYVKKTYGQPRRTEIVYPEELATIDTKEIEVEDYNVRIFVTNQGYLKKVPLTSLRGSSTQKLKDDDKITYEFDSTNRGELLIFTNKHNCFKYKLHELNDSKPSLMGEYLPSLLQLNNEEIVYVAATSDYKEDLLIGFSEGKVARISLSSYETKQNRKMLANAYSDKDKPIYWNTITSDIDLVAVSDINKVIMLNTSFINSKSSKTTQGVTFQKSKDGSKTIAYLELDKCNFEDNDYYKNGNAGVGKYLKKTDSINI